MIPNAAATREWVELDVALLPEPALCLGLIALANDGTIEGDMHAFLRGDDIRICTTRVYTPRRNNLATLSALQDRLAVAAATLVPDDRLDVVAFGCTSGAMALGPENVRATLSRDRPSLRVTDPVSASLRAFERLGCRRIAVLTPYVGEVNAMVGRFLSEHGLDLRATGYFPLIDDNARARVTAASFEDAASRLTEDTTIEGLFISCTALRTAGMIERLEQRIGRPVVSSNQALSWDALRLSGYTRPIAGGGQLLRLT
jgi:maleate isomerase